MEYDTREREPYPRGLKPVRASGTLGEEVCLEREPYPRGLKLTRVAPRAGRVEREPYPRGLKRAERSSSGPALTGREPYPRGLKPLKEGVASSLRRANLIHGD